MNLLWERYQALGIGHRIHESYRLRSPRLLYISTILLQSVLLYFSFPLWFYRFLDCRLSGKFDELFGVYKREESTVRKQTFFALWKIIVQYRGDWLYFDSWRVYVSSESLSYCGEQLVHYFNKALRNFHWHQKADVLKPLSIFKNPNDSGSYSMNSPSSFGI